MSLCSLKEKENNLIVRKVSLQKKTVAINLLLKDKFRIYNLMFLNKRRGEQCLRDIFYWIIL